MLKIKIVAVGKIKERYFKEGQDEYVKRLSRFGEVKVIEVKEETFVNEPNEQEKALILKREGEEIEKNLSGYIISCCIEGEKYSSIEFSNILSKAKDLKGEITFVIGGSYGLIDDIKRKSDKKLSVSDMTFPHTLFRVMLLEQIYRAFMISSNGRYHK